MFGKKNQFPGHGAPNQDSLVQNSQSMAFWLALLATILFWPTLWDLSVWLVEVRLIEHVGYEYFNLAALALAGCMTMVAIYLAKMSLSTTFAIAIVAIIAKIPVF